MSAAAGNYPTWLNELRGESPVLSASEWRLLDAVRSTAQKIFGANISLEERSKPSKELSSLVDILQKLVKYQKKYSDSGRYFQKHYPQWRLIRNENIKILREIADTIQKNKENCDAVRLAGSLASMFGGGTSLAAEDEDSFAAQLGRGLTFLGSAFAAGSTLVEELALHVKIEEAKDTVEKDRFYFDLMWPCHVNSSETVSSLDKIFEEIDTNRYQWKNVWNVIDSFVSATSKNRSKTDVEIKVQTFLNVINVPPKFQEEICDIVSVITAIVMVCKRHRPLFELASNVFKVKQNYGTFMRGLLTVLNVWSKDENSESTAPEKSLVVAGMLMDLVNVSMACKEVSKGSQRKESENIRKVANILEKEANDLRRMYNLYTEHDMPMYA